jgi:hypothetical protein
VSGQPHASATLPPGKEPPVSIDYEAEWVPEPVSATRRGKKFLPLPGLKI